MRSLTDAIPYFPKLKFFFIYLMTNYFGLVSKLHANDRSESEHTTDIVVHFFMKIKKNLQARTPVIIWWKNR